MRALKPLATMLRPRAEALKCEPTGHATIVPSFLILGLTIALSLPSASWAQNWAAIKTLEGHTGAVVDAAFSPDGTKIVTASWDKTARIWDTATGRTIAILPGHSTIEWHAVFSPDGTRVATASYDDNCARIWDVATGRALVTLEHAKGVPIPDGETIPDIFKTPDGKMRNFVLDVAFSHDGTRVLTRASDNVRVWDAVTGRSITTLEGDTASAVFSPRGNRVATVSEKTATIWDAATGQAAAILNGHTGSIRSVAFSANGAWVVTASEDGTARVWDSITGKVVLTVTEPHLASITPIFGAMFSPDGDSVFTGSLYSRIWGFITPGHSPIVTLDDDGPVNHAMFSLDGRRVLGASNHAARIFDAKTGHIISTLQDQEKSVNRAIFAPDGVRVLTASGDGTARIWEPPSH